MNIMNSAAPTRIGSDAFYSWATATAAELAARRAEINALNVFPVPDSDTGSNMAHTMESAVEALEAARAAAHRPLSVQEMAAALAHGSVRGARGNSGMVLSQILRAISLSTDPEGLDAQMVRTMLRQALIMVNEAMTTPIEGTVITVLRAAAVAADTEPSDSVAQVVYAATEAARTALRNTPSQLDALRQAGVVDAGGAGLVVLLECLAHELDPGFETSQGYSESRAHIDVTSTPHCLEVMFYYVGDDIDALHTALAPLGDSLVIARASESEAQVHIHSDNAGRVIETAYAHAGTVSDLRLEVLPPLEQAHTPRRVIIVLCPEGDLAELYREAGAVVIAPADKSGETVRLLSERLSLAGAKEVVILPNGMLTRRELVSAELSAHASGAQLQLVPTHQLVVGLAAIAVHDARQPLAVDTFAMTEAASAMTSMFITAGAGGWSAWSRAGLASISEKTQSSEDLAELVIDSVRAMLRPSSEMVTLLVNGEHPWESIANQLTREILDDRGIELCVYSARGMAHTAEIGVE